MHILAGLDRPTSGSVWIDGTDTNRGLAAQGYLDQVLARISQESMMAGGLAMARPGGPDLRIRVLYNPAMQSRWFMVPGVLVLVLAVITMLLSAMAVVKEREQGTIEQLSVTPIRPIELILGKLVPFVIIGGVVASLAATVGEHYLRRGREVRSGRWSVKTVPRLISERTETRPPWSSRAARR